MLGGAIKYLKQMEERIKLLEEEKEIIRKQEELSSSTSKRKRIIASAYSDDRTTSGSSSSDDSSSEIFNMDPPPEIEVRISDTNVLVRVYWQKRNGIIKEILGEIEKLGLGIISSSVIPFGTTTLNITVIAQVYIYIFFCTFCLSIVKKDSRVFIFSYYYYLKLCADG